MKIGLNRWTLPPELSLERCFQMVARAGFDAIEVNLAEDGELNLGTTEAEARAIAVAAGREGLELRSLSTGLGWKAPLTSQDADVRKQGERNVLKQLQVARWLGADTILVVPGMVTPQVSYDDAYRRASESLRGLFQAAADMQVSIGVENVWNKFLLSPLEFARFIDEIDSPWVGAYFDVGNVLAYGYPDQWIRILGTRIRKIHVKDFRTSIGNGQGFCNPLQGDVPWAAVRRELDVIGYTDTVVAEVGGYNVHAELGIKHIAESLREVFGEPAGR